MSKSAIIYLTRQKDLWTFVHSINLLWRNFCSRYNHPVIVFHDDLTDDQIFQIKNLMSNTSGGLMNLSFQKIQFKLPDGISTDPSLYEHKEKYPIDLRYFGFGYRHMCRLFSGQIMNQPCLSEYKYYWRLDSDSFILSAIKEDPFEVMSNNGYIYSDFGTQPFQNEDGWPYAGKEVFWAREGLSENSEKFSKDRGLPDFSYDGEVFNTNMEIVDLEFFRGERYQSYFDHMDSIGGFYYQRWGDAPFRWLGVRLFSSPDKVWFAQPQLKYCYQHGSLIVGREHAEMDSINMMPEVFRNIFKQENSK